MHASIYYLMFLVLAINPNHPFDDSKSHLKPDAVILKNSNDTLNMIQTIKGFLHWYKQNYKKANSFKFTYEDKPGNYQVNLKDGENYLQYLKSSGYISDEYISLWMKYFTDKASYLKENLQNEGPPEGFEFDLILITQEPELILNAIEKLEFVVLEAKNNKAVMQISGDGMYNIDMTKKKGKWKIDYIATENYD